MCSLFYCRFPLICSCKPTVVWLPFSCLLVCSPVRRTASPQASPRQYPFRTVIPFSMFVCKSIITQKSSLSRISRTMEIRHKSIKFPQCGKWFFHMEMDFVVKWKYLLTVSRPLQPPAPLYLCPSSFCQAWNEWAFSPDLTERRARNILSLRGL